MTSIKSCLFPCSWLPRRPSPMKGFLSWLGALRWHALLKKFTSKVDGFTFGTNLLMVITSEVKVFMTFWFYYVRRYYLLREVAWHWNLLGNRPSVNIWYFCPSTVHIDSHCGWYCCGVILSLGVSLYTMTQGISERELFSLLRKNTNHWGENSCKPFHVQ